MSAEMLLAAALAGLVALAVLWRLSRRKRPKPWVQVAVCSDCGWRGQVSRHAGRCPRCNARIGERRGERDR